MESTWKYGPYPIRPPFKPFFIMFKKKTYWLSRGEGKNTVAIALSQADPWVEIDFVSLFSPLHGIPTLNSRILLRKATPSYHYFHGFLFQFLGIMGITFTRRQVLSITSHNKAPCRERS